MVIPKFVKLPKKSRWLIRTVNMFKNLFIPLLCCLLIIVLVTNLWPQEQNMFDFWREKLAIESTDPTAHFELAKIYESKNDFERAEEEIVRALEDRIIVVGSEIKEGKIEIGIEEIRKILEKVREAKAEPGKIEAEILELKKVADSYPNYRDVYIRLSILEWKLFKTDEARRYLEIAERLDPNHGTIISLKELFNK